MSAKQEMKRKNKYDSIAHVAGFNTKLSLCSYSNLLPCHSSDILCKFDLVVTYKMYVSPVTECYFSV